MSEVFVRPGGGRSNNTDRIDKTTSGTDNNDDNQHDSSERSGSDSPRQVAIGAMLDEAIKKKPPPMPSADEHKLEFPYSIWYSRKPQGGRHMITTAQSYEQSIKLLGSFCTVEQFWNYYCHMIRPSELSGQWDFHVFKYNVKPLWEDDTNKNGGKWIVRVNKGACSRPWEYVLLAMLGEQFMVGEELCGVVLSLRYQDDVISVWNRTATDLATTNRIRDTLRRVLNLPPHVHIEYKKHTDSLRHVSAAGFGR